MSIASDWIAQLKKVAQARPRHVVHDAHGENIEMDVLEDGNDVFCLISQEKGEEKEGKVEHSIRLDSAQALELANRLQRTFGEASEAEPKKTES